MQAGERVGRERERYGSLFKVEASDFRAASLGSTDQVMKRDNVHTNPTQLTQKLEGNMPTTVQSMPLIL